MRSPRKPPPDDIDVLAADVAVLSRLLTRERERLPASYLRDERNRRAYLRYFVPVNTAKVHLPLRELALHPERQWQKDRLRVLDIGSGPGTALLGVLEFFSGRERRPQLELTAVDAVAENLDLCRDLVGRLGKGSGAACSLHTIRADAGQLPFPPKQRYDLVILSNVLNELFAADGDRSARRVQFLAGLMNVLDDGGACIIIEPALRETSRGLLEVREGLIRLGIRPYAPCVASGACGALLQQRDWCHEDLPWEPPELVREVDRRIGLRKDSLKFSYLVLDGGGRSLGDAAPEGAVRVVSEPLISKGKTEFYLCGAGGRKLAVRLDREASASNSAFRGLRRGMLVRLEGALQEEKRIRIAPHTRVEVLFG